MKTDAETVTLPERPELVFPDQEAEALRMAYAQARAVLEYGAGGSTVLAAELGTPVVSVESDGAWAERVRGWIAEVGPSTPAEVIHADVGPTGNWGFPVDDSAWRGYPAYPLAIWDRLGKDLPQPDVVLVDGRFRTGCVLAAAFRSPVPLTLLLDDYTNRSQYHEIEDFVGQPTLIGRLAVFDIAPMPVPADRMIDIYRMMTHA
ncbi:hypothetical protein [Pseudooceanicola sp. HF7]|uniref:hypothetical protein n=1 Tax=Pseudooceanicola sp. HF7 TaxID=2721560 RepID=UPI0014319A80|nr:hypothetical protein [Pseudooceanicola sp. HF7]